VNYYNGEFYLDATTARAFPLILMFFYAYAGFLVLMLFKCLFENTNLHILDCSKLCEKCKKKPKSYSRVEAGKVEEEEDLIL
jgi:hypothetical protein